MNALPSSEQLTEIRELLNSKDLILDLRPEWGAQHDDHRLQIRGDLSQRLNEDLRDLKVWPQPKTHSVAISHCFHLGGFAIVERPYLVGMDIEITSRVRVEIIKRVSNPGEAEAAPVPAALWTAKEAAFKALSQAGLAEVMADFTICDWTKVEHAFLKSGETTQNLRDNFLFRVSNPQTPRLPGQGLVFSQGPVFVAIFLMQSK